MEEHQIIEKFLRRRLSNCNDNSYVWKSENYDQNFQNLHLLLRRTCDYGESNSVIVAGPRGSGKTLFLDTVLRELRKDKSLTDKMIQVNMNGLLHTNDMIAIKEITRQLKLENVCGDKVFGSFQENLLFLLESLKEGHGRSKSIIFIFEEFDLFCHHKNQTLLYNMFDVSQSASTPIAVVGLTCRLDVQELLEKRVKSRFSHRHIYLHTEMSFSEYMDIGVDLLQVPSGLVSKQAMKHWNQNVDELFENKLVRKVLKQIYYTTKDLHRLKMILFLTISQSSDPLASSLLEAQRRQFSDMTAELLAGLSVLELCVIIAMKHITNKNEGEPFNFQMVYHEMSQFVNLRASLHQFDAPVVMKAYEHLLELEFMKPVVTTSKVQKEYQMVTLLVDDLQIDETIQNFPNLPTEIQRWGSSCIV